MPDNDTCKGKPGTGSVLYPDNIVGNACSSFGIAF